MNESSFQTYTKGGDTMNDTEFQALQQVYGAYCAAIVSRILTDSRDCEECLNDVWLRVWKSLDNHKPANLKGWLGSIARNCAITRLLQLGRQNRLLEDCASELAFTLQNGPAEQMESRLLGEAISAFLKSQPKLNRIVFLRRYWYADTVEQAANHVGWTVSKTKTVLYRIRLKLKDYLMKEDLYDGS